MIPSSTLLVILAVIATGAGVGLWSRRIQRKAIQRVLRPEIAGMRLQARALAAELARRHRAGMPLDADFFWEWRLSAPLIYPAVGPGLGLLSAEAVERIGFFHAQLAAARDRLAEVQAAGGVMPSPYRLLSNLLRACKEVEPWLRASEHPAVGAIHVDPETSAASALMAEFEQRAELLAEPWCWADVCFIPEPEMDDERKSGG